MIHINSQIPAFKAQAFHNGKFVEVTDQTLKGKWSVFIFMPAAFTFNCPTEVEDAADNYEAFQKLGAEVYIVTTDTHFSHKVWHETSPRRRQGQVPAGWRPHPLPDQRFRRAHPRRRSGPAWHVRHQS